MDCIKEDEKLYLKNVQTVSKIEQNNNLLWLSLRSAFFISGGR